MKPRRPLARRRSRSPRAARRRPRAVPGCSRDGSSATPRGSPWARSGRPCATATPVSKGRPTNATSTPSNCVTCGSRRNVEMPAKRGDCVGSSGPYPFMSVSSPRPQLTGKCTRSGSSRRRVPNPFSDRADRTCARAHEETGAPADRRWGEQSAGRETPHPRHRRRRRPDDVRRRRPRRARLRGAHRQQRRAGPRARLHRSPAPRPARRHDAGHGRLPGVPRAAVRLHQGHPGRLPHREDGAGPHDGGQPLRRLRLRHQAVPHRAPAARPSRDVLRDVDRVLRRDHRPADAGQRPGRGAADAVRPQPARHPLRDRRRRARARAAAGLRGRRRRLPRRRQAPARGARRAHPQRGLRLRLEPRQRVPGRPLAVPRHRASSATTTCWWSSSASRRSCSTRLEDELESRLLAKIDLLRRLRRASPSRPRSASGAPCSRPSTHATRGDRARARRDPRTACARSSSASSTRGAAHLRVPADRQPRATSPCVGYELLARGPLRERAAPARRALRGRARRGPRPRARPPLPHDGGARQRRPAGATTCASSTRSRSTCSSTPHGDDLRAGVRRRDARGAARPDRHRDHREQRHRRLRPHARRRRQAARARLPHRHRRRRRRATPACRRWSRSSPTSSSST